MKRLVCFSSLGLVLLAIGCGGSGMSPMPQTPPTMTGNFGMTAVSTGADTFSIGGPIQSDSNGSVSGVVRVDSSTSKCFDFFTNLTVTGTISPQGQLSMTTGVYEFQTITVAGIVSGDGKSISAGTFTINGGCAAGIRGTLTGFQVPTVNATYTGSFTAGGSTTTISIFLTQGNSPATFGLAGNSTFSNGSACALTSGNILGGETGFIAGADVRAGIIDSTITTIASFGGAITDGSAKTIQGTLFITTGPCTGTAVPITLNMAP